MSSDLYSFANLWRQYRACRRNKRNTLNALAFEIDAEAKLLDLQRELRTHAYRPGRSVCFVTEGPKPIPANAGIQVGRSGSPLSRVSIFCSRRL